MAHRTERLVFPLEVTNDSLRRPETIDTIQALRRAVQTQCVGKCCGDQSLCKLQISVEALSDGDAEDEVGAEEYPANFDGVRINIVCRADHPGCPEVIQAAAGYMLAELVGVPDPSQYIAEAS